MYLKKVTVINYLGSPQEIWEDRYGNHYVKVSYGWITPAHMRYGLKPGFTVNQLFKICYPGEMLPKIGNPFLKMVPKSALL